MAHERLRKLPSMRSFESLIGLSAGDCAGAVGRSPSPIASSFTAKRPLGVVSGVLSISCRNVAVTDASGSSYEAIFGDTGDTAPPVIAERPAGDAQPPAPARPEQRGTDAEIKATIKSYIADEKPG